MTGIQITYVAVDEPQGFKPFRYVYDEDELADWRPLIAATIKSTKGANVVDNSCIARSPTIASPSTYRLWRNRARARLIGCCATG